MGESPPTLPAAIDKRAPLSAKITLIITQAIYAVVLMPWLAASLMSVMAFDKPGSENSPTIWMFVLSLWAYPVVAIVATALAWLFFVRGHRRLAIVTTFLPALYIAGWFLGFILATH